jgi:ABC-type lipoprotein export system ATPase subunit
MQYARGTEWRIWDLHVHTPESIENTYRSADNSDVWDRYLKELANLPGDIKVIGINDYWFFDGYRRVREAFDAGKLPNLEQIFPVLEVRCDTFSGAGGDLSRINLHIIGDPEIPIDRLKAQLDPLLTATYQLTPNAEPTTWSQFVTRDSMHQLGQEVIAATPEDKRQGLRPLRTGFNNLNVSFEKLREGILNNSLLRDHTLLAIGKIEWAKIKWTQGTAANKKHLINSVDAVFTASPSNESFDKSRQSLLEGGVNAKLLDCSDAHSFMDCGLDNRLGQCRTWINADPTFKGLRHALHEYDSRVTTAERPPVQTRMVTAPKSILTSIKVRPRNENAPDPLFDVDLPINSGFSVIIGNKGQGKSALLDTMASAANSDRDKDFSFLTEARFRSGGGKLADQYEAEADWSDGTHTKVSLNDRFDPSSPSLVDYLPQTLIEKVCSADPNSVEKQGFEHEIERVLFRHIPAAKRRGASSLRSFLDDAAEPEQTSLKKARLEIREAAEHIENLRARGKELDELGLTKRNQLIVADIRTLDRRIADIDSILGGGTSAGVAEQPVPADPLTAAAAALQESDRVVRDAEPKLVELAKRRSEGLRKNLLLQNQIEQLSTSAEDLRQELGLQDGLLTVTYRPEVFQSWLTSMTEDEKKAEDALAELRAKRQSNEANVAEIRAALKAESEENQVLIQEQSDLRNRRVTLVGDPSDIQSLEGIKVLIEEEADIPKQLATAHESLESAFKAVHSALLAIMSAQEAAYRPAADFVAAKDLANDIDLEFAVELRVRGFVDKWVGQVNRQKLGDFHDLDSPMRDTNILGDIALGDADSLFSALKNLEDRLCTIRGAASGDSRSLQSIMRTGQKSADLLSWVYGLEWLQSQYVIRSEGRELSELSPGQRGLVLLLFYLLVDLADRPLLLDQPEENLDNQTVKRILVPALKDASLRRQVVAVTHNPNFAVVGDADQIIVAEKVGDQFVYVSGSLASLGIGSSTIDVLEGTREAFKNRNLKYDRVVGRS